MDPRYAPGRKELYTIEKTAEYGPESVKAVFTLLSKKVVGFCAVPAGIQKATF